MLFPNFSLLRDLKKKKNYSLERSTSAGSIKFDLLRLSAAPKVGYGHLQNQEASPGDSATPPLGGSCPGLGAPWPLLHPGENVSQTLLMKNAESNRNNTALQKGTETLTFGKD